MKTRAFQTRNGTSLKFSIVGLGTAPTLIVCKTERDFLRQTLHGAIERLLVGVGVPIPGIFRTECLELFVISCRAIALPLIVAFGATT